MMRLVVTVLALAVGDSSVQGIGKESIVNGTDREQARADALLCSNTCQFQGDGECDDGGLDTSVLDCTFGTDCANCGVRVLNSPSARDCATTSAPTPATVSVTTQVLVPLGSVAG
jgi:hypothetical protein